jgi:hypothetical protein
VAITQYDQGGRAYRMVSVGDVRYRVDLVSTKHTIYERYGAVFTGNPRHSITVRALGVIPGYTREPALVRAYAELWTEQNAAEDQP